MEHYKMRKINQEIKSDEEKKTLLKNGKFCSIAMCYNNKPYIVSMNYGYDEENNYIYMHGANEGRKIDILKNNPNICITIIEDNGYVDGDCNHYYRSLIIEGRVEFITEPYERLYSITKMIEHFEGHNEKIIERFIPNGKVTDSVTLLKVKLENITGKFNK